MNTINKYYSRPLWFAAILLTAFVTGCGNNNDTSTTTTATTNPAALTVVSTNPAEAETAVATNRKVTATFSESMNVDTLDGVSFAVKGTDEAAMIGTVTLDAASNTAIFSHNGLSISKVYTATITAAASSTGKTMPATMSGALPVAPRLTTSPPR